MPTVYHLVPPHLCGDVLYPLNRLHHVHPDAYERQSTKYVGREPLQRRRIPALDCRWGDVLFLSPVHPTLIRKALEAVGLAWPVRRGRVFAFDVRELRLTADDTAIWLYEDTRPTTDFEDCPVDIVPYDEARMAELTTVPERTYRYFEEMRDRERRPLLFVGIPHVLYRGAISLGKARVDRI